MRRAFHVALQQNERAAVRAEDACVVHSAETCVAGKVGECLTLAVWDMMLRGECTAACSGRLWCAQR